MPLASTFPARTAKRNSVYTAGAELSVFLRLAVAVCLALVVAKPVCKRAQTTDIGVFHLVPVPFPNFVRKFVVLHVQKLRTALLRCQ